LSGSASRLEPNVLVRRRGRGRGNQGERRLLHSRSEGADESVLPDRGEHDALVQDLLDLMQQLLALLAVELLGLALEEILDLGEDAVRVPAIFRGQALDASGRVAACALHAQYDAAELLLRPRRQERGALHCP